MREKPKVLINSAPLRVTLNNLEAVQASSSSTLSDFFKASTCSSYGVVVWKKDNIGEILIQESFAEPSIHYIFNDSTIIVYDDESNFLGPGTMVEVFWTKKMSSEPKMNYQLIVHIDKIKVYKCCSTVETEIWIVHSNNCTGMTVGMTEQNNEVVYHPSCTPELRKKTLKAVQRRKSEFSLVSKYENYERLRQMIRVWTIYAPFSINVGGSIEKIRSFVIEKIGTAEDFKGPAVVTNVVKNMCIEAKFLDNEENVILSSRACHSNLVNRISLGSIVVVRATSTFKTSHYKWYGYEVTVATKEDKQKMIKKFRSNHEAARKLLTFDRREYQESQLAFVDTTTKEVDLETEEHFGQEKTIKKCNQKELNTVGKHFKLTYRLLDGVSSNLPPTNVKKIISSYFGRSETEKIRRRVYSEKLKLKIQEVLKKFNLNRRNNINEIRETREQMTRIIDNSEKKEYNVIHLTTPKTRPGFEMDEILKNIGENGFVKCKKVKELFVLPDTNWKPRERRFIGIHDDFQWVMLGTFCRSIEEVEQMATEDSENDVKNEPFKNGWWYRRSVAREVPTTLVKYMETCRNIVEDCTKPPIFI